MYEFHKSQAFTQILVKYFNKYIILYTMLQHRFFFMIINFILPAKMNRYRKQKRPLPADSDPPQGNHRLRREWKRGGLQDREKRGAARRTAPTSNLKLHTF